MGDVNGVDICQQTHVEILRDAGVMRPEHVLEYNSPLPFEHTLEGLYIDDHVVLQVGPKKKYRKMEVDPKFYSDEELIARSRQQYAKLRLPVSADKRFTKLSKFKVWGTEVDSSSGRVGTPIDKLRQLCQVTCSVLRLRRVSKKCLEQLVGLFIHPFMHRRLCVSVFGEVYTLLETWPCRGRKALPKALVEEFVGACLILPLCHTNIRWPVSQRVSSADASLSGAGRCATRTLPSVSRLLHRAAEHVGERVRLDWETIGVEPLTDMRRPNRHLERLASVHKWVVTLELDVLHREYLDLANNVKGGLRSVNLTDSRVVLGAVAKGRSSSRRLNRLLRKCLAVSLASSKIIYNLWVSTHHNPSDYPSRFHALPPPAKLTACEADLLGPDWMSLHQPLSKQNLWDLCASETCQVLPWLKAAKASPTVRARVSFQELFTPQALLSECFRSCKRWLVLDPHVAPPSNKLSCRTLLRDYLFADLFHRACRPNRLWHMRVPCREREPSACQLSAEKEFVRRVAVLCCELHKHGSWYTVESDVGNPVWAMIEMQTVLRDTLACQVDVDMRGYNLRVPDDMGVWGCANRPLRFSGTLPRLQRLHRVCRCSSPHVALTGAVRLREGWFLRRDIASRYPLSFCRKYAAVAAMAFKGLGLCFG